MVVSRNVKFHCVHWTDEVRDRSIYKLSLYKVGGGGGFRKESEQFVTVRLAWHGGHLKKKKKKNGVCSSFNLITASSWPNDKQQYQNFTAKEFFNGTKSIHCLCNCACCNKAVLM